MKTAAILITAALLAGCQTTEERAEYDRWYHNLSPEMQRNELMRQDLRQQRSRMMIQNGLRMMNPPQQGFNCNSWTTNCR